jgi:hypothetical protein
MSRKCEVCGGGAGGVGGDAAAFGGPLCTTGGPGVGVVETGCSPIPFCNFNRNPSFSISNTERSFFRIKSMMALISLSSTVCGMIEPLGNPRSPSRSRREMRVISGGRTCAAVSQTCNGLATASSSCGGQVARWPHRRDACATLTGSDERDGTFKGLWSRASRFQDNRRD